MATMELFIASSLKKVTVHANNNYYPKDFGPGPHTLENLPSSGNIWIVPSNDVTFASGYGLPVNVTTQNPSGSWKLDDDNYIKITDGRSITLTGTKGGGSSSSYEIEVVFGAGIEQVSYQKNQDSLGSNPTLKSSDFTVDVGKGGYLYIGIARINENYTHPVKASASSGTSSWTVIDENGKYKDQKISAPSSSGTRTVTLTATPDIKYYYKVHAFANGGYFSSASETDYYTGLDYSRTISFDFDCSQLTTPKRAGYTFLGWGYSSNATQYYTDTITISATSQSSTNPTNYNLFAIWKKAEFTCHIKIGAGINSASVYVDGALKSDIRDKVYHDITVSYDSTITVKSIAKATGYTRPYKFNFYQNSSSTVPTSTMERDTDEPSYAYSDSRFYAEIVATKSTIDLFYWNTAGTDASLFAAGKPISNLTAARWNKLKAKIKELADAWGSTYTYTEVSKGDAITAAEFNGVRTAINNRAGHGTLPAAQSKGDPIKASLFEGSASLKSALNAAITYYNNY